MGKLMRSAAGLLFTLLALPTARAADLVVSPKPWEIGMSQSYSPIKDRVIELNNLVLVIITLITLFVGGLLLWIVFRYNAKRNPVPTQTTHNTVLEVAWTVIPVLILVVIAIPSFKLIYYQDRTANPDMTIKVTGHQWYWEYSYPDQGNLDINSRYVGDDHLQPGDLRLLTTNASLVVPVGKRIRVLIESADVIHSFFVPPIGVQRYAVPGHTIETWLEVDQAGTFYGQCNQLCGENHHDMPISLQAMNETDFNAWVAQQKKAAQADKPVKVASP